MSATPNDTLEERWSDLHFDGMADLWKLSEEDCTKMKTLQARIAEIDHWKNDPYEVIRYYKEYKGNLKETEKMFRYMVNYRLEHDFDNFLTNYGEPDPGFHNMPIAVLDGMDKDGDPIYLDRIGAADSWGLLKHFGIDAMTDYIIFIRELNNWRPFWKPYEDKVGHRVRNFTVIIDLQGLSSAHMRPGLLSLLQRTARVSQDCYAGWGKRIILLRAPSVFKLIWKLARNFFDEHIQNMIVLTNHTDYLDVLEEYVDLEVLPPCISGDKGKGKAISGYFDKVSLDGGPIPKKKLEDIILRQKELCRQESTVSTLSDSGVGDSDDNSVDDNLTSTINVSTSVMMKGYFDMPVNVRDDVTVTTYPSSSDSALTVDF